MTFLYALSGWQWWLAGAIPAGIVALYFLKLKRKPLEVPSTFLWRKSVEDLHVNSLLQRLRRNLLLFLQLLVAALALFALLHPTWDATDVGRRLIIAIDQSASMSATDVSPSRLEQAKTKAREIVEQMKPGDAGMVIAFSDSARVACPYTTNHEELRQAIAGIAPTNRRTRLNEAMSIASGLANPQKLGDNDALPVPASLYLLSDGKFPSVSDIPLGNLDLKYMAIGQSSNNVALVGLSARRGEQAPERVEVFARMRNYSAEATEVVAELLVDGKSTGYQKATVDPDGESSMTFRLLLEVAASAMIEVKLDSKDDFPVDNHGYAVISPPRRARVLVIGDDDVPLKATLETKPLQTIARISHLPKSAAEKVETTASAERFDLIIFDRCAPTELPDANTLFLGSFPPTLANVPRTPVENPILLNWKTNHPALRFLSLDDVHVVKSHALEPPRGVDSLIESNHGPLLMSIPRGVYSDVVQTFALVDDNGAWLTDWPLKLSFPLYVLNLIQWLGGIDNESRRVYLPGEAVSAALEGSAETASLVLPSGESIEVSRSNRSRFDILRTEEIGVYSLSAGEASWRFAVNLFDEEESSIAPAEQVQVGAVVEGDQIASIAARRELWRLLALLAFIVVLVEWYIYNRRVYV